MSGQSYLGWQMIWKLLLLRKAKNTGSNPGEGAGLEVQDVAFVMQAVALGTH